MENFVFENPTKVFFGNGCVREYLSGLAAPYQGSIMLAWGGGSIRRNGVYDEVCAALRATGRKIVEFSGIMSNPTYKKVLEGAALARKENVGLIIAVGGGSVMDCCKAISIAARYDGDVWNDFWAKKGSFRGFDPLSLGIVVTVSGTGSECNGGAVITNEDLHMKTGRDYPECNARFSLLDPAYTFSVPRFQMVAGAFDTLSHLMEIYFSAPDADNVSDDISEALMRSVIRNLRAALRDEKDYTARSNLMWDATMAENRVVKLGKKTDFMCHMMEHQIGAYVNCNHGAGLAVLHPAYYRRIYKDGLAKFVRFAVSVWGIERGDMDDDALALRGIDALASFIREIGLPTTLREVNVTADTDLRAIADSVTVTPGCYRRLSHEEIYDLFREVF